jgi:hypothetical protein
LNPPEGKEKKKKKTMLLLMMMMNWWRSMRMRIPHMGQSWCRRRSRAIHNNWVPCAPDTENKCMSHSMSLQQPDTKKHNRWVCDFRFPCEKKEKPTHQRHPTQKREEEIE